jgi:hypothetical protein
VLYQIAQDFEALWRQQDALIRPRFAGAPEALVDGIETEGRELLQGDAPPPARVPDRPTPPT